jgi:hypothetical protein
LPSRSITTSLLPEKAGRVVSVDLRGTVVVDGAVAGVAESRPDRKASTAATAARTPRAATTIKVTPFRKPQKIRGAPKERQAF